MPRINSYDPNYAAKNLFEAEAEKSEQVQLYRLVTLIIPNHPVTGAENEPLRLVDANHDVVYGWQGNPANKGEYTYTRFPLKYSPADINSDGSISKTTITIANVSREIMAYVEDYNGLKGARVHIKTVYANVLYYLYEYKGDGTILETVNTAGHNPAAHLHDEHYIDNYTATETTVSFQLEPIIDLEIRLPRRRFLVDSCSWVFKDPETCGYVPNTPVGRVSVTQGSKNFTVKKQTGMSTTWTPESGTNFNFGTDTVVYTVETYNKNTKTGTLKKVSPATINGIVTLDTDSFCNKTLAACKLRGNQRYAGLFPGISGSRRIFL